MAEINAMFKNRNIEILAYNINNIEIMDKLII